LGGGLGGIYLDVIPSYIYYISYIPCTPTATYSCRYLSYI